MELESPDWRTSSLKSTACHDIRKFDQVSHDEQQKESEDYEVYARLSIQTHA